MRWAVDITALTGVRFVRIFMHSHCGGGLDDDAANVIEIERPLYLALAGGRH
jgi:hypothetical protein